METNALLRDILAELRRGVAFPVAPATPAQQDGERARIVPAAKEPRDYINEYLDDHPGIEQAHSLRALAAIMTQHYERNIDHTTVSRVIKKRRSQ